MDTRLVAQRSKAALDADIRARRRTALVVNVRSRRGRRHFATVHRRLQATVELVDVRPVADPRGLPLAHRRHHRRRPRAPPLLA